MKVRRESDCKLNLDSSENITQAYYCCVHTMHVLYSSLTVGDRAIRCCNSGVTCAVTSTLAMVLESSPKPGDDTLSDSKILGYFHLGTPTFQTADNSTT
ncbi:uncharacterized protein TNCV_1273411 [Trichonephila clavipes]|nr:uncharacterized protein TNCV_1273411 [Trichonephila clavipes]